MEIKRFLIERVSIQEFADRNGLVMEIRERPFKDLPRYYAAFAGVEVSEDGCLVGAHGNGDTEEQAMSNYAERISSTTLVVGAFTKDRREIQAPRLYLA